MAEYSSILLEKAVDELSKLPGIGRKTALRLALHLLGEEKVVTDSLSQSLLNMRNNIVLCKKCYNISDSEHCSICSNPKRDNELLCVVADMRDVMAIERTGSFNGVYHVLGGVIAPSKGYGAADLDIDHLLQRIENEGIKEIIIATNPTLEGETTALFLAKLLEGKPVSVTRLGYGLPMGASLDYADSLTLEKALEGRRKL